MTQAAVKIKERNHLLTDWRVTPTGLYMAVRYVHSVRADRIITPDTSLIYQFAISNGFASNVYEVQQMFSDPIKMDKLLTSYINRN